MSEIIVEIPEPESEVEPVENSVADEVVIDELAALKENERERTQADIAAVAILAQSALDTAQSAHTRIDNLESAQVAIVEEITQAIEEVEAEPIEEVEPEPEPEHREDKEPERKHWFWA